MTDLVATLKGRFLGRLLTESGCVNILDLTAGGGVVYFFFYHVLTERAPCMTYMVLQRRGRDGSHK